MDDVRGCLVLSRDGLVLAAFPEDEESAVKPAWLKFTHVGDARRSFVEFADQIWAHIHRGPYAAFVVAGTTVDLVAEREGKVFGIDLIGQSGALGAALDLERYRMLQRAGLTVFPLSLASWISNESSCLEAIERHST
jgi:hypothetical protein